MSSYYEIGEIFILQCLKFNLAFCAKHIVVKNNNIAVALSRF